MNIVITNNEADLVRLEGIIQQNLVGFVEAAHAFKEIRDKKYYCDVLQYKTFEQYCRRRWDMGRRYMNRLIAAGDVVDNLGPMGPVPENERQVRPLTALTPEQQRQAWKMVLKSAPEGKVTERHVVKAVKAIAPPKVKDHCHPEKSKDSKNSEDSEAGHLAILKKQWRKATPSDRSQFLLWIDESREFLDKDSPKAIDMMREDLDENYVRSEFPDDMGSTSRMSDGCNA